MTTTDFDWARSTNAQRAAASKDKEEIAALNQMSLSREVLDTANEIIHGERAQSYGPAEDSFARIAEFWTTHLSNKLPEGVSVDAYDVAIMMTLMKCARAQTDIKQDTFVDIAGYAALAPRCAAKAKR